MDGSLHLTLRDYSGIAPKADLLLIQRLAEKLSGKRLLHITSTRSGGGVAEILLRMVSILNGLGIDTRWEVITGNAAFFEITKKIHNALQGNDEKITDSMWQYYHEVNRKNAGVLNFNADLVMVHDPQPAALIDFREQGIWLWRCHIDMSNPLTEAWDHVGQHCKKYDAAVFSVTKFTRAMPIDEFIIPPAIAPLSDKNRELTGEETDAVLRKINVPTDRPIILQVSRFDRFKDPIGVVTAYRMVKKYNDCILVLAGSRADDDPEGETVLKEIKEYAGDDPDIYILQLPPGSDMEINALQRAATVILQKSLREGFGLTITEAMWKGKPVIGGAAGGIPIQVVHGVTGFIVHSVEGAALRTRQILNNPEMARKMGENGREHVKRNFLITRQIRDYLAVWHIMENKGKDVIEFA